MNNFDLDTPLIITTGTNTHAWTIRNAVEGVQIFGSVGSGKTTGSGRTIALKYLTAGFGGLVLTVKPDEKDTWIEYCKLANREKDLIIVEADGKHTFDFLQYESNKSDKGASFTDNLVDVLKTVIKAGESADKGKSDDQFWETALDMLIYNVIDLCLLAYNKVTVQLIYDIVLSLPKNSTIITDEEESKAFYIAYKKVSTEIKEKIQDVENYHASKQNGAEVILTDEEIDAIPGARIFKFLDVFFWETFKNLSDKTRSIVEFTFSGFLFRLLREPVFSLFCKGKSTFSPEDSLNGKIILIHLPVKKLHKVGRDCQILFKYVWQRSMEQRNNKDTRPVFLWADEAQNFLHEHDVDYQATARSSRIATVYITQNLPNYFAKMGGERSEDRVKSFIATLGTKIFHANSDVVTNQYGSELIGDEYKIVKSESNATSGDNVTYTVNENTLLERSVRPEEFACLNTGGVRNNHKVQCIFHQQGDPIKNGKNYIKMSFNQIS
ncbi:MAG: TraM recognition domain-containing protein [Bacteroidota bacterium]